ncbi:hypothetical protein FOZ62_031994, partial [Perkinsus olseni]
GAAYRQILKKPYGLQERNIMNCGESKRSQWPRASVMSPEPEAEEEPWALDETLERQFDIRF